MTALMVICALALDKLIGEPSRFHPLVLFGGYADRVEKQLNKTQDSKISGIIAYALCVLPFVFVAIVLTKILSYFSVLYFLIAVLFLYLAIGWQSLLEHADAIYQPLLAGDMEGARHALSMIVSRDTQSLNEHEISKATVESILENGADAIFSAIFWFVVLGIPGVVLYRLSNTLDAMWGYKNEQFLKFGWCAARMDDVLNYIPARLTAVSYALCGRTRESFYFMNKQSKQWKSPNAGPVMSAGAGALNISLGGQAMYHGRLESRPTLGPEENENTKANPQSILQAKQLLNRSLCLWAVCFVLISWVL